MTILNQRLKTEDHGQNLAEYALILAVILVLAIGTIRLAARSLGMW